MQRDMDRAIEQWKAARETYESVDEWGTATNVVWWLMDAYLQTGDFQTVYDYCAEMAEIYRQHGLRNFVVGVYSKESLEKSRHGDLAEAVRIRQRCIDLIHESGPEYQFAWNYWEMGELMRLSGDLAGAAGWFERAFRIFEREPDNVGLSFYYRGLGDIAYMKADFEAARQHFRESVRHSRTANHIWMIAYAVNGLGRSELALEHYAAAQKHLLEALEMALKSADRGIMLVVLAAYAALLFGRGRLETAAQLASLAADHVLTWHETRKQAEDLLALLKKSLPPRAFLLAQKQGSTLDLWETIAALVRSEQPD
jgi:tetratricopeptide (TPR) repeat protein